MKWVISILTLLIYSTKNPVKLSFLTLVLSSAIFFIVWKSSSSAWIPVMMMMLFTGGVLIMFMILASISPNESTKKMKISYFVMPAILIGLESGYWSLMDNLNWIQPASNMKVSYSTSFSPIVLTLIIVMYFYVFIQILGKKESSMRSSLC